MNNIPHFIQINPSLASSGQPAAEDFSAIAAAGYQTIINLAPTTASNAISHEDQSVIAAGMTYVQIAVPWEQPHPAHFDVFRTVMRQQGNRKIWVHCALNMRVSAFIYLYNVIDQRMPEPEAQALLFKIWRPNAIWQAFMDEVKAAYPGPDDVT